jgi:hypothetical protein
MGLPLDRNRAVRKSSVDFSTKEIKNIERKLYKFGDALNLRDKVAIYLEEAYSFYPSKEYWPMILTSATDWWRLYYEFVNYLIMNNWYDFPDIQGLHRLDDMEDVPGYRLQLSVVGLSLDSLSGSVKGLGTSYQLWDSQIYLDYQSVKKLADEVAEQAASLESDRMNIRNILKGN